MQDSMYFGTFSSTSIRIFLVFRPASGQCGFVSFKSNVRRNYSYLTEMNNSDIM
jgi:hypothetical protein